MGRVQRRGGRRCVARAPELGPLASGARRALGHIGQWDGRLCIVVGGTVARGWRLAPGPRVECVQPVP